MPDNTDRPEQQNMLEKKDAKIASLQQKVTLLEQTLNDTGQKETRTSELQARLAKNETLYFRLLAKFEELEKENRRLNSKLTSAKVDRRTAERRLAADRICTMIAGHEQTYASFNFLPFSRDTVARKIERTEAMYASLKPVESCHD